MGNPKQALLALFLLLSGCGIGRNPGGTGGDGGGGGSTAGSRTELFDSIEAKLNTFTGADRDQENLEMLAFLQTKPEFATSGLTDFGGAWGRFADGTTLIVTNNLDVTLPASMAKMAGPPMSSSAKAPAFGIPDPFDVMLGTSLGDFWEGFSEVIPAMFEDQKYGRILPDSSVDALKNLNGVSVLYLLAHGDAATLRNNEGKTYTVWTSTKRARDGSTDHTYDADLKDGSLTYFMSAAFNLDAAGNPHPAAETHYGITTKFIPKYWTGKFHKDSLVFMNTCGSSSLAALQFKFAVLTAGASVYIGWTDRMIMGDAITSAAYFFDRLLGTNKNLSNVWSPTTGQETPPQRAFDYLAVIVEMATRPRVGFGTGTYDSTFDPKHGTTAKLELVTLNGEFRQLAPSIDGLGVDEQKDELIINGFFGSTQTDAKVTIGTTELTIKSWSTGRIVCVLPRTGAGTSGGVMVTINRAQHSNVVQLTEWHGTATCGFESKGTLKMEMNFNLHFRADVHEGRNQPHGTPFRTVSNYFHALDSSGSYVVSGTYTTPDGIYQEDWSGSGEIPAFIKPPDGTSPPEVTNVLFQGGFDENRQFSLAIRANAVKGNSIHTVLRDTQGQIVSDQTEETDVLWLSLGDLNGNLNIVTATPGFDIPGGRVTVSPVPTQTVFVEWSAMSATNPPDPTAAK